MQHAYSIFGLQLQADRSLPALKDSADGAAADVRVWMREIPRWAAQAADGPKNLHFDSEDAQDGNPPTVQVWRFTDSGAFLFRYRDGVEFVIDSRGENISAKCGGSATFEDAASYLVGVILGFALRLSGRLALHASVVAIDEHAVVLLGDAGSGKSTTAAAFANMGYGILTDDVCVPVEAKGRFWIEPAYPGIRLWPDSVNAMFGSRDALPKITPSWEKRLLRLSGGKLRFYSSRLPVGKLYWLKPSGSADNAPKVSGLGAPELMLKLISMSYPGYLLEGAMKLKQFDTLGRLAAGVQGARVEINGDLSSVSRVCEAIIEDFKARSN